MYNNNNNDYFLTRITLVTTCQQWRQRRRSTMQSRRTSLRMRNVFRSWWTSRRSWSPSATTTPNASTCGKTTSCACGTTCRSCWRLAGRVWIRTWPCRGSSRRCCTSSAGWMTWRFGTRGIALQPCRLFSRHRTDHIALSSCPQARLLSPDFGKHLLEVEDLLQKHTLLENDIALQAERVHGASAAALRFANGDSKCWGSSTLHGYQGTNCLSGCSVCLGWFTNSYDLDIGWLFLYTLRN